jgi:predicted O-methyltransferase YrrM
MTAQPWWKPSPPEDIPARPWLSPAVIEYLETLIKPEWDILEHGCGGSTLWFAQRCKSVTAYESDPDFAAAIRGRAPENVKIVSWSKPKPPALKKQFDLLLIDGEPIETRGPWIDAATRLVKPGGIIVLDNYNRPEYKQSRLALENICLFREFNSGIGLYLNTEFFYTGEAVQ